MKMEVALDMNKIRYYFTFDEFLEEENVTNFNTFKTAFTSNLDFVSGTFANEFEDVFILLANLHKNAYVTYTDYAVEDTLEENFDAVADYDSFIRQFYGVYRRTYDRYVILLTYYTAQKNNLLNQVSNETKTKFNDTPQGGGNYDNDRHLSTITTTTSSSDITPLMERLDEIESKYKNLVSDWAEEFNGVFIQEGYGDYDNE